MLANAGLNPYYTGSYSMRAPLLVILMIMSLNPYYTGSYSMSADAASVNAETVGLNPYYTGSYSMSS